MSYPSMQPAAGAQEVTLSLHDGNQRTVHVTEKERPYPKGRLIVSRTDTNGIITHANDAFIEISGYTRDELIGQPHNVLRHPDMPHALFQSLWETMAAGKKWHGYIKNLCKDGSHYWVYATAVPNVRQGKVIGYASVRREPSRRKIDEAIAAYKAQRAKEGAAS